MIDVAMPDDSTYTVKRLFGKPDSNTKLAKSNKAGKGYLTIGLSLAAHKQSGYNICPFASAGCSKSCLMTSGYAKIYPEKIFPARIAKTRAFFQNKEKFREMLFRELTNAIKITRKKGLRLAVRLNILSDLQWEKIFPGLFETFSDVQFYDYTKIPNRIGNVPANYHLTFSRSETNNSEVLDVLRSGGNVAVVFDHKDLPDRWEGYKVANGDKTDLRFLDDINVVVGLSAKGDAKKDRTGFVIRPKISCIPSCAAYWV